MSTETIPTNTGDLSAGTLDDIERRVRFFDNQFLRATDMIDEQHYHMDRQRRLLKYLYTPGIVTGLDVKLENGRFTVSKGTAIDAEGRQIVLTSNHSIDPKGATSGAIVISFDEDGDPVLKQDGQSMRWLEDPLIEIISGSNPDKIVLAQIKEGKLVPDSGTYAGMRMRGPLNVRGDTLVRTLVSSGPTILTGQVTINSEVFKLGGGVPSSSLTVNGPTTLSGPTTLNGTAQTPQPLTVNGTTMLNGSVTIGTAKTPQSLIVSGAATLNTGLTVNGAQATLNNGLTVYAGATVNGSLIVNGAQTMLNGGLTISNGGLTVSNALTELKNGLMVSSGELTVTGIAKLNGDMTVGGLATLNRGLTVNGLVTVDGTVSARSFAVKSFYKLITKTVTLNSSVWADIPELKIYLQKHDSEAIFIVQYQVTGYNGGFAGTDPAQLGVGIMATRLMIGDVEQKGTRSHTQAGRELSTSGTWMGSDGHIQTRIKVQCRTSTNVSIDPNNDWQTGFLQVIVLGSAEEVTANW